MFAKSLAAVLLAGALMTATAPAYADEGDKQEGDKAEGDKAENKGDKAEKSEKKEGSKKSNLVARVNSELSAYTDTESVTVVTPTIGGSIENPLSEWSVGVNYLVDVVSAASVDIVATASQRWREVRQGGSFDAAVKPGGLVGLGASGSFSVEPDYVGVAAGATVSIDLFQKNATLLAGYSFGRGEAGRSGTPFSVFSHVLYSHSINGALTLLVNRDTLLAFIGDAIIESGNQAKPYRYVPMFAPDIAVQVPVGASIDLVNQYRLNLRPLEQLPLSRDRFAVTVRLAHRFSTSTLRVSERFYRDTWGLTASSTDVRYVIDAGTRVALWPHARLHLQTPVSFWQRAYSATQDGNGNWQVPTLRTGDRELGPSRGLTGGAGIQIKVGPDASPSDFTLNFVGESVWTSYLNDIYISNRVSGLGVVSMEAVFE
jgi:Protein of unknown function (DUF3570)